MGEGLLRLPPHTNVLQVVERVASYPWDAVVFCVAGDGD